MSDSEYWELWDSLPPAEQTAHIAAVYAKHGYDPAAQRAENRMKQLEERVAALESELDELRNLIKRIQNT